MPKTVVHCSMPGCYACATHVDAVVAYAQQRPQSLYLAPHESVGEIGTFPLLER